jgi:hypothetical protein
MYQNYFGLAEPPFSIAPDPRYLYTLTLTETDPASAQEADPPPAAADWDLSK